MIKILVGVVMSAILFTLYSFIKVGAEGERELESYLAKKEFENEQC